MTKDNRFVFKAQFHVTTVAPPGIRFTSDYITEVGVTALADKVKQVRKGNPMQVFIFRVGVEGKERVVYFRTCWIDDFKATMEDLRENKD